MSIKEVNYTSYLLLTGMVLGLFQHDAALVAFTGTFFLLARLHLMLCNLSRD